MLEQMQLQEEASKKGSEIESQLVEMASAGRQVIQTVGDSVELEKNSYLRNM